MLQKLPQSCLIVFQSMIRFFQCIMNDLCNDSVFLYNMCSVQIKPAGHCTIAVPSDSGSVWRVGRANALQGFKEEKKYMQHSY